MVCRKPIVCCELHNGVTYVNQHEKTGLVVPPRDPVALADAINRLNGDMALRERLGTAGYRRVTTEFTPQRMRDGMLDVYRQVLNRRQVTDTKPMQRAA